MTNTGRTVEQTSHRLVFEALRATVRAGPGALETSGSIRYRASALLYLPLLQHPIDEHGRCRSCPSVMTGLLRPRRCRIHLKASDWLLHYPDGAQLLAHLAEELGTSRVPPGATGQRDWPGLIVRARTDPPAPTC